MGRESCQKKTSIGGQALIEGIMMRGPHKSVMANRRPDGSITVEDVASASLAKRPVLRWPIIRGAVSLIESMILGYRVTMLSAERAGMLDEEAPQQDAPAEEAEAAEAAEPAPEEEKKDNTALMAILGVVSGVLGVALAVFLFMYLPSFLFKLLNGAVAVDLEPVRAAFEGVLKVLLFLGYLIAVSQMKDIKRVFRYHGAEHKSIFCYEKGLPLTVENVREQKRFHPRCGTSFLVLMLLVSILFYSLILLIPAVRAFAQTTWLWALIKLVMLPVIVGFGYELIKFCGRHDNWFTRVVSAPGMWVQRITTKEPEDEMIEVAIAALEAVIPANGEDDRW
ncbi:MAG: DUF1385 domain-containing protein [Clostridia bacterium]|nr:DUF1385 domain-containing protein [Clostridia bacterium]